MPLEITLVGGATAVLDFDGLRVLTDPTFDPPKDYPQVQYPITLVKTAGPAFTPEEIAPIHLVLASHDHEDNLDNSGRAFLAAAPLAFTTPEVASQFNEQVEGLDDYQTVTVSMPDGRQMSITAVPARHGPEGIWQAIGPVIGFVLSCPDLPTVYISGDNSSLEIVDEIQKKCGPIDVAVLFAGGAGFEEIADGAFITLSNENVLEAAKILDTAVIVPIHTDSWAHFRQRSSQLRELFEANHLRDRLIALEPGESSKLPTRRLSKASDLGQFPSPGIRFALPPAADPVAASFQNQARQLGIDLDHFAGPASFMPTGPVQAADASTGGLTGEPQRRPQVAGQDPVNRGDVLRQVGR